MKNTFNRIAMWLFMPDLSRQMIEEGVFNFTDKAAAKEENQAFVHVEDRGADITIFAFSGIDVLYAGLARFEFQNIMRKIGQDFNVVYLRDLRRSVYHLTPDNAPNGLEFHINKILELKESLGAKYNIAIGSSSGGSAALYACANAGFDFAITFGPLADYDVYTKFSTQVRTFLDFKKLFREPKAYFELIAVTAGVKFVKQKLRKKVGEENIADPLGDYAKASPRPRLTVFYGKHCKQDTHCANELAKFPETKVIPLDTGRHNSPAYLKNQGTLEDILSSEIAEAVEFLRASEKSQATGTEGKP